MFLENLSGGWVFQPIPPTANRTPRCQVGMQPEEEVRQRPSGKLTEKKAVRRTHNPGCGGFIVRETIPAEEYFIPVLRCVNCGWYGFLS